MVHGGNRDGGGVHVRGIEQLADRAKSARAELRSQGLGAGGVGVHDGGQFDRLAALVQFVVDARVVAAECAGADDGDCESLLWRLGGHGSAIVSENRRSKNEELNESEAGSELS